jgi:hypothetical protein
MKYNNGDQSVGKWESDKQNGSGILYKRNGEKHEGIWKDDKLTGVSVFSKLKHVWK